MKSLPLFLTWPLFLAVSIWGHMAGGPVVSVTLSFVYLASMLFILTPKTVVGRSVSKRTTLYYIFNWLTVVLSLAVANALGDALLAILVSSVGAFIILFLKDDSSLKEHLELCDAMKELANRLNELEGAVEVLTNERRRLDGP